MHLTLRGSFVPETLLVALRETTNRARLSPQEVGYDREAGVLRMPMLREVKGLRRGLVGRLSASKPIWQPCVVTLRRVSGCEIVFACENAQLQFVTLLFGLEVKGLEAYLSSAEEDEGELCYSVKAQLEDLDVEVADTSA